MQTANSRVNLSPPSDIIAALQIIVSSQFYWALAYENNNHSFQLRLQPIMPDLGTPYSRARFPSTNRSAIELKDRTIGAIITERQQQLDTVLHQISSLETVMDSINNLHQQFVDQKDKIIQSVNLHKRLGSALWRLPTEVLSQIFHYCLPPLHGPLESSFPSKLKAPMLLTRICRPWREVAVGIPSLWCRLTVEAPRAHWQRKAFCYDSWLKRSRGPPLSLQLYSGDSRLQRNLLQPYMNQILSISFRTLYNTCEEELMLKDLVALQELTIRVSLIDSWSPIAKSISQLSTLRSLKIMDQSLHHEQFSSLNPVWAHLTNVEITINYPNLFLHLLHLCPDLSSSTIHARFSNMEALEPFTHTKLQSLCIDCHSAGSNDLSHLFNALSLLNLHVLEVTDVEPWPHKELKAFLSRSNCPLESLVFGGGVMPTDEQRAEYVALIPSLEVHGSP
ncbi:hypothetical protein DFH29DRAFT_365936 [Suillus ampliporus]|nr:hypothetical protein DFH29DRAFT_365936 [Suillus ampliporus]